MAYMNQERKAAIAKALKAVVPKSWKYSLAVRHHSTICLTIQQAPVDFLALLASSTGREQGTSAGLNPYHWRDYLASADAATLETFEQIFAALNAGNHDRSDITTDYFDVGWYVDVGFGRWNKPFIFTGEKVAA